MQSLALSPPYISMGPTCDMIGMQPTVEINYAKIEEVTRIRTGVTVYFIPPNFYPGG